MPDTALTEQRYTPPKSFQRPNKFTPLEAAETAAQYFTEQINLGKPFTNAGIARALNISSEALDNYRKGEYGKTPEMKQQYVDCFKWVRSVLQEYAEEQLFRTTGQVAGAIFTMKNLYQWRDDRYLTVDQTETHQLVVQLPPELANALETRMESADPRIIEGEATKVVDDT